MTQSNQISQDYPVIIIGGGLAGLVSALHLSKQNINVLLIEKNEYPRHKVCGEYISNEVLPYLKELGYDPFHFGAKDIKRLTLSSVSSKSISVDLPLGGFGLSRYTMDATLAEEARSYGTRIIHDTVIDLKYENGTFSIATNSNESYTTKLVIGAYGKRSNLDVKLSRPFLKRKSPYLAVKAHYSGEFPNDIVSLHNFKGGYCGLSKVDTNHINVCYITDYKSFKAYKNIDNFQREILSQNKHLKHAFENYKMVFEKPLTISQVSFETKEAVENHMLMCGDSAGMIHPLAGNGMSMAIRSAQLASTMILRYLSGEIKSRSSLETEYQKAWKSEFQARLNAGHVIARLFRIQFLAELMMDVVSIFPAILRIIIRRTHGKPMIVNGCG